eukprot:1148543-Pelagomonas_calceolata.AAC.4
MLTHSGTPFVCTQAKELLDHLEGVLSNKPVEIVGGSSAVEIKPQGVSKGQAVEKMLTQVSHAVPPNGGWFVWLARLCSVRKEDVSPVCAGTHGSAFADIQCRVSAAQIRLQGCCAYIYACTGMHASWA